jgi:elongation factor P hydroxylase
VQRVTFDYRWHEAGRLKKARRRFEIAWIMPRELERLLRMSGFAVEQTWGDYDGSPLGDRSPRQIVRAVRGR